MSQIGLPLLRQHLLSIYQASLKAVNGRYCVMNALKRHELQGPVHVVAIGKAAVAMYQGAYHSLRASVQSGLVITKYGHAAGMEKDPCCRVLESGHPIPDAQSLVAGQALLSYLASLPANGHVLFLISGGASSLVEVLPDGITLDELRRVNNWLLGSGLDIHAMNHVRKAISAIKGGRLVAHLAGRPTLALLISDVPGDDPATIGSGLLTAEILDKNQIPLSLPEWLEVLMHKSSSPPPDNEISYANIQIEIIATLDDAMQAAAQKGAELGYNVALHAGRLGGNAVLVGRQLATELLASASGLHVWGGETTVSLPEHPGRGGRNQHLALAAAIELEDEAHVALLAAGTDGSDGSTADAGAMVDGGTLRRARLAGYDSPGEMLARADSGTLLEASGDLIHTGPTETNTMDIMLGIKMMSDN